MYRIETENFILELLPHEYQETFLLLQNNSLRIKVFSYGFSADFFIDADDFCIDDFSACLSELYKTRKGTAELEDLYSAYSIVKFVAKPDGYIRIFERLNNKKAYGYEQELTFDNETDQIYLREFITALFNDYGKYAE